MHIATYTMQRYICTSLHCAESTVQRALCREHCAESTAQQQDQRQRQVAEHNHLSHFATDPAAMHPAMTHTADSRQIRSKRQALLLLHVETVTKQHTEVPSIGWHTCKLLLLLLLV